MAGRIVLFGATGYTGELTARALLDQGARPVLAARHEGPLRTLAEELGGLEWALANVTDPPSIRGLLERGDVLVSTVGPFVRLGGPAVRAATDAGAHYIDSTGEGSFIREVFEVHGPRARGAGCGLLTAFGYDWVPGNLAGGLALRDAGPEARSVEIGYFFTGERGGADSASGGTRASLMGAMLDPGFAFRDHALRTERPGRRLREFELSPGRRSQAISVPSSEHLALPRLSPSLSDVDVYLGWFGPASRVAQGLSAGMEAIARIPGAKDALARLVERFVKGSTGGPDATARARSGSLVLAEALDAGHRPLASVRLEGVNGYDFTARVLAWGARAAAAGGLRGIGALGPVDGFGLDALTAGCAEAGISRVG
ncbi:MAG TPA: saccharopine dehydrogenase NADP-binding domain-containing protein [Solirubrobacteraceae bacterium]|jgi:short subunit dehydrogenase-like uncharacterized protein|nr:saccharopine dehydrogenase NADP-binding domain-containing protein [Solirubrobacteraceae bacterium]